MHIVGSPLMYVLVCILVFRSIKWIISLLKQGEVRHHSYSSMNDLHCLESSTAFILQITLNVLFTTYNVANPKPSAPCVIQCPPFIPVTSVTLFRLNIHSGLYKVTV